jgi:2-polyprenyl-6-methoxyphenol hydroxylase-like FAD-dependent oxidoreductase
MAVSVDSETDVLIAGAGPTGLVLALWLAHWGVRVRIIDKTKEPGTTSRALAVQARTLELYAQIGLADAVMERCRPALAANLWVTGKKRAHLAFGDMGGDKPLSVSDHLSAGRARALVDRSLVEGGYRGRAFDRIAKFRDDDGSHRRAP